MNKQHTEQAGGGKFRFRLFPRRKSGKKNNSHLLKSELKATAQSYRNNANAYKYTANTLESHMAEQRQSANAELVKLQKELDDLTELETCNVKLSGVKDNIKIQQAAEKDAREKLTACEGKHEKHQKDKADAERIHFNYNIDTVKAGWNQSIFEITKALTELNARYESLQRQVAARKSSAEAHKQLNARKPKAGELEALRAEKAALLTELEALSAGLPAPVADVRAGLPAPAAHELHAVNTSGHAVVDPNEMVLGDLEIEPENSNRSRLINLSGPNNERMANLRKRIDMGVRRGYLKEKTKNNTSSARRRASEAAKQDFMGIPEIMLNTSSARKRRHENAASKLGQRTNTSSGKRNQVLGGFFGTTQRRKGKGASSRKSSKRRPSNEHNKNLIELSARTGPTGQGTI
jgi:hypothetical protein